MTQHFVALANVRHQRSVVGVSSLTQEVLETYPFPGNVRELRNAIERAVVITERGVIEVAALPERMREHVAALMTATTTTTTTDGGGEGSSPVVAENQRADASLRRRVRAYERELIVDALARANGNRSEAAASLALPLRTLSYKMRELEIKD